jgi:hypothetical protein
MGLHAWSGSFTSLARYAAEDAFLRSVTERLGAKPEAYILLPAKSTPTNELGFVSKHRGSRPTR